MEKEVTVHYFAQFQEITDCQEEAVSLDGETPLDNLLDKLIDQYPELKETLNHAAISVNLETVEPERTTVEPGDEVALLPPFGGGSST